ncbi:MAG: hypothetical protein AB1656_01200 [Candidatus Omnitrophota bacterium]
MGALTPAHLRALIHEAKRRFEPIEINGESLSVFRDRREIWGELRTLVAYVSAQLEKMSTQETTLMDALGIQLTHLERPQFQGVSVYASETV